MSAYVGISGHVQVTSPAPTALRDCQDWPKQASAEDLRRGGSWRPIGHASDHEAGSWWWDGGDQVSKCHREGRKVSYYSTTERAHGSKKDDGTALCSQTSGMLDQHANKSAPGMACGGSWYSSSSIRRSSTPTIASTVADPGSSGASRSNGEFTGATACSQPRESPGRVLAEGLRQESRPRPPGVGTFTPPSHQSPFVFVSPVKLHDPPAPDEPMPPMSKDGGSQEEFEEYWDYNSINIRRYSSGWVEYRAHPQVKNEPYWFHLETHRLTYSRPEELGSLVEHKQDDSEELGGSGPAWEMSIKELKAALGNGKAADFGLNPEDLAQRAVAEYERFLPRVLSWHDYQYLTFWFFGGMDREAKGREGDKSSKSFFGADGGATRSMFADDTFFHAAARLLMKRMHKVHPINLTYFVWTFSRAGVVIPELMQRVADHWCTSGQIPMCDRCSLGTMVWNFSKCGIRHDRYFELTAAECVRPNRLRSLAPRNFQNTMIAYSRMRHWHEKYVDAMARGIVRLLDAHDPRFPKTAKHVLFSYTCKDGSEVPADAFRIGSLTVLLKAFKDLRAGDRDQPAQLRQHVEACCASMASYVRRSVAASPQFMREPGDACDFFLQLARVAADGRLAVAPLLPTDSELQEFISTAPDQKSDQLQRMLRRVR